MTTPSSPEPSQYIVLDELQPSVELAACYDYTHDPWFRYRVPGAHFLLCKSGHIEAKTPNGHFHAKAGDLLAFRATDLNQYGTHGRTYFYEAHITFARPPKNRLTVWLDEVGPLPEHLPLGSSFDRMRQVFDTYCLNLSQRSAAAHARVISALWEMLDIMAEVAGTRPMQAHRVDEWQRARIVLGSDLTANREIQDLAKEMGLTPDHFIRRFKQRFGTSPKAYRTQAKLRHAAQMLRAGSCSIKTLAYELGFADAYSFTRAFKRYLGVLPSDVRAGEASSGVESPAVEGTQFKLNTHIIPADAGKDFYEKFHPTPRK
ncbi:MAG: helix-turn-helix transcriptional regulator [Planctomycetes bacterium]|nr:helix-turn-helix transcriptional regulator [Planctomycetota bacterium]